ncbi:MAG: hypothetical protein ACXW0S_03460 [Solirubrobacterales bacterium]
MAWIETESLSFTARHDDADTACAQRILDGLEELRLRLEERFDVAPGDVTVVIHDNPAWLAGAHPLLPVVRWTAAPAARRYIAGWPMAGEIHVLSDEWMERRAAGEDSLRALLATAERMYAQLVLAANNDRVPPMWTPRRFLSYLQWAWLIEGAAQYFTGQVSLYRAAVITRLREGERPRFPPSRRDAILLGGTVFDLLDRHAGPQACALLASRLHRSGARGNLELAFDARMHEIERAWRHHLDGVINPHATGPGGDPLHGAGDQGSPLGPPKPSPLRRPRTEPIDLHDLGLGAGAESAAEASADFEFEDPFEGELRIRRGAGLRSPSGEELPKAPEIDFGPAPEFGFETSGGDGVEQQDEPEADPRGGHDPKRQPRRRPDPGK